MWRGRWTMAQRVRWAEGRKPPCWMFDFSGLADQLLAIGRAFAHGVAALPRQIGQASGQRLVAAQAARAQNVADFVGEPADLGCHQSGDRVRQSVEPLSPVGLLEQ